MYKTSEMIKLIILCHKKDNKFSSKIWICYSKLFKTRKKIAEFFLHIKKKYPYSSNTSVDVSQIWTMKVFTHHNNRTCKNNENADKNFTLLSSIQEIIFVLFF